MASSSAIRAGRAFVELYAENSKLVAGLRAAEEQIQEFGKRVANYGKTIAAYSAIAIIPFVKSEQVFSDLDDVLRAVKAVSRATQDEFDMISNKAKYLGRTTSFTSKQVAESMLVMGRAGFNTSQIDKMIAHTMNLARATGTEIEEATNILSNAIRQFGLDASSAEDVADVLVAATNSSAQSLTELGYAFSYVAPVAKEFRMSLRDTAKVVGTLANFGVKSSMAGTSLRAIITRMSNSNVQNLYSQIGVPVTDDMGKWRNIVDIIQDVGRAVQNMPDDKKMAIFHQLFGLRAISGGIKLTGKSFDELNAAIDNAAGTAKQTAKDMDAGIGGSFRLFYSALSGIGEAVGQVITPFVKVWTDGLTEVMNGIADWIYKNGEFVVSLVKSIAGTIAFGVALTGAGIALKLFGMVLSGAMGILWAAANIVTFSVRALGVAMVVATSPVTALVLALGAIGFVSSDASKSLGGTLVGAFKKLTDGAFDSCRSIADVTQLIFGNLKSMADLLGGVFNGIGEYLNGLTFGGVVASVDAAYGKILAFASGVMGVVKTIGAGIAPYIAGVFVGVGDTIEAVFSGVVATVSAVLGGLEGAIRSTASGIVAVFGWVADGVRVVWGVVDFVSGAVKQIGGVIESVAGKIASVVTSITAGIGAAYTTVVGWFSSMASSIIGAVGSVASYIKGALSKAFGMIASIIGPVSDALGAFFSDFRNVIKLAAGLAAGAVAFKILYGTIVAVAAAVGLLARSFAYIKIAFSPVLKLGSAFMSLGGMVLKATTSVAAFTEKGLGRILGGVARVTSAILGRVSAVTGKIMKIVWTAVNVIGKQVGTLSVKIAKSAGHIFVALSKSAFSAISATLATGISTVITLGVTGPVAAAIVGVIAVVTFAMWKLVKIVVGIIKQLCVTIKTVFVNTFIEAPKIIIGAIKQIFTAVVKIASEAMSKIKTILSTAAQNIWGFLSQGVSQMAALWPQIWKGLSEAFSTNIQAIEERFWKLAETSKEVFAALKTAFSAKDMGAVVDLLWAYIKNAWTTGFTSITDIIYTFIQTSSGPLIAFAKSISETFFDVVGEVKKAFYGIQYTVIKAFDDIRDNVITSMNTMIAELVDSFYDMSAEIQKAMARISLGNQIVGPFVDKFWETYDTDIDNKVNKSRQSAKEKFLFGTPKRYSDQMKNPDQYNAESDQETAKSKDNISKKLDSSKAPMEEFAKKGIEGNVKARKTADAKLEEKTKVAEAAPITKKMEKYKEIAAHDTELALNMQKYDENKMKAYALREDQKKLEGDTSRAAKKEYKRLGVDIDKLDTENARLQAKMQPAMLQEAERRKTEHVKKQEEETAKADENQKKIEELEYAIKMHKKILDSKSLAKGLESPDPETKKRAEFKKANAQFSLDSLTEKKDALTKEMYTNFDAARKEGEKGNQAFLDAVELFRDYGMNAPVDENETQKDKEQNVPNPFLNAPLPNAPVPFLNAPQPNAPNPFLDDPGDDLFSAINNVQLPAYEEQQVLKAAQDLFGSMKTFFDRDLGALTADDGGTSEEAKKHTEQLSSIAKSIQETNSILESSEPLFNV